MTARSAADSVVLTDAFRNVLRRQRDNLNAAGKPRRPDEGPLSRARFATLLNNDYDASTIGRWETGATKAIPRETVERLTEFELPADKGKLFKALGILPKEAENMLSRYRIAVGTNGLPLTLAAVRAVDGGLIAEEVYSMDLVPIPVTDVVLTRLGRINRHTYVPPDSLGPDTPLIAFKPTGVLRHSSDEVDIVIGLPSESPAGIHQFAFAHAAAHRLLGHGDCHYRPTGPSSGVANEPDAGAPESELMANDVAVRLLAPKAAVRRAYANASAAVTRAGDQTDLWAIGSSDQTGQAPPAWAAIVMAVATELNVPGWLAFRRLTEERLMDVPGMVGLNQ